MTVGCSYQTHVENLAWLDLVTDGLLSGTTGQSLRIEAIKINMTGMGTYTGGLSYRAHVQGTGWQAPVTGGQIAGTVGLSTRLEAVEIQLTGDIAALYSIYYRVHVQNEAWQGWKKDGETAGTTGAALRAEAIQILIVPIGTNLTRVASIYSGVTTKYRGHIENIGWKSYVLNGRSCGTIGLSLRQEAIQILLTDTTEALGIEYAAHVQGTGWQAYVANGATAGTVGSSLRMEAIKIRLTGADAALNEVHYRVHIEGFGWQAWVSNDAIAGTTGSALRLESVMVIVTKAGNDLNAVITNEIVNKMPYVQVRAIEYPSTNNLIHDIRIDNKITGMKLTKEENKAGMFSFNIHSTNDYYADMNKLKTEIEVTEIDSNLAERVIFCGRIIKEQSDFNKIKTITCEGELAYLNDVPQRPASYTNATTEQWITQVLDVYNFYVTFERRIFCGLVTKDNTNDYALRENDYIGTLELLNKQLVDLNGGELLIEKVGGLKFLNYQDTAGGVNTQKVEFGKNLLALEQIFDATTTITSVIPTGKADADGVKLTIASVNSGSDYIYSAVGISEFGVIQEVVDFNDIEDATTLMAKGYEKLEELATLDLSLQLGMLDLFKVNVDIQTINCSDAVHGVSTPHGIDSFFKVVKKEQYLQEPDKDKITLNKTIKKITEKQANLAKISKLAGATAGIAKAKATGAMLEASGATAGANAAMLEAVTLEYSIIMEI